MRAQWPGVVEGRMVDAVSGLALDGVVVEASPSGVTALSDASGRFALKGLAPGRHTLVARRLGYATLRRVVVVENGRRLVLRVALDPVAVPVEGLRVEAAAREGLRVEVGAPGTAGARTAADLLRALPGVTVTSRGPGGAQTVSIRGSGAGAVLVLLDGVPLNDPLTGEADLSTVPAAGLASATVLPGARSARYGAGAEGGVVVLETRLAPEAPAVELAMGSLGQVGGEASLGGRAGGVRWSAAVGHERLGGRFSYTLPPAVGGASGERANADVRRTTARAALEAGADGALRVRAHHDRMERGLPGRAFAPSPEARRDDARSQLSVAWTGRGGAGGHALSAWVARREARHRDPAPPAGLPYDASTRARGWGLTAEMRRELGDLLDGVLAVDLDGRSVEADALATPRSRVDAAARATLSVDPLETLGEPSLRGTVRLHRDGRTGGWRGSHEVALGARLGVLSMHVAHRSAWTPPTLADLFFREGLAVRPNPDLRPERVPSELEAGVTLALERRPWTLRAGATAYRGDVRDMVVWAPDFRFVWSPRNVDVRRRGVELWGEVRTRAVLPGTLQLDGSWSHARATYDRDDDPDLQLAYRPRHAGVLGVTWTGPGGSLGLEGRYTGLRYPTPSRVNALPGFWAWHATATRPWRIDGWTVEARVRVERLRDTHDALIFGFPHPGRTLSVEVAVQAPRRTHSNAQDPPP